MTSQIDEILDFLALNQGSYDIEDLSITLHIPPEGCDEITKLLAKYGFVVRRKQQVEINPNMKEFVISTSGKDLIAYVTPLMLSSVSRVR